VRHVSDVAVVGNFKQPSTNQGPYIVMPSLLAAALHRPLLPGQYCRGHPLAATQMWTGPIQLLRSRRHWLALLMQQLQLQAAAAAGAAGCPGSVVLRLLPLLPGLKGCWGCATRWARLQSGSGMMACSCSLLAQVLNMHVIAALSGDCPTVGCYAPLQLGGVVEICHKHGGKTASLNRCHRSNMPCRARCQIVTAPGCRCC
jgi:hypothetical protein